MKKLLVSIFMIFAILPVSFSGEPNKVNWDELVFWQANAVGAALKKINATEQQSAKFIGLFFKSVEAMKLNGGKLTAMNMTYICMQVFALGDADGKATEADYDKCVAFIFALIDEQNKIAEDSRSRFDKAASDPNGGQLSIADASRIFKNMNAGRCNPNSMRGFSQYRKIGHEVPAVTDSIVDCQPVVPYKKNTFNCRLERYLSDSTKCVVECTGIVFKKSGAGYIIEGICEVESIQKASGDSASAPLR